jgi:hypothetical protein
VDKVTGEVTSRPWAFNVVRVLVAGQDVAEVTIFRDNSTPVPAVGDEIDYAVEMSGGRAQVYQPWAALFPAVEVGAGVRRAG